MQAFCDFKKEMTIKDMNFPLKIITDGFYMLLTFLVLYLIMK